jgi:hypothetical protein
VILRGFLLQGRYRTSETRDAYLKALRNMDLTEAVQYEHDHLYDCLSILDVKATALIGFNSILVATSTIALTVLKNATSASSAILFAALFFAALSSAMTLFVLTLRWTETAELADASRHFEHLLESRDRRSLCYRIAWLACLASLVLVVVGVVVWRAT